MSRDVPCQYEPAARGSACCTSALGLQCFEVPRRRHERRAPNRAPPAPSSTRCSADARPRSSSSSRCGTRSAPRTRCDPRTSTSCSSTCGGARISRTASPRCGQLLEALDHAEDVEQRYGFHRIVVLVSGPEAGRLDDLIVELGAVGVRYVLRQAFDAGRPRVGERRAVCRARACVAPIDLTSSRHASARPRSAPPAEASRASTSRWASSSASTTASPTAA